MLPLQQAASVARWCRLAPNWCDFIAHGVQIFRWCHGVQSRFLVFNILCTKIYRKYFVLQGKIDFFLFFKTFFNFGVLFGAILDACGVQC